MKLILMLIPMVAVMTLACSAESGSGAPDDPPSSDEPLLSSPQPADTTVTGPSQGTIDLPGSIIEPVVDEIARIAGVAPAEIVVISGDAVTFPNGGLGCPELGMAYTQVQVDGYRIVAVADGTTYDYRGTGAGMFRRCR